MQLSNQNFFIPNRYTQSFADFSNRKNKLLPTALTKSKISTNTTLPKLSRSLSSNSTKSAKERISTIHEQL